jgi:hypothetical protein
MIPSNLTMEVHLYHYELKSKRSVCLTKLVLLLKGIGNVSLICLYCWFMHPSYVERSNIDHFCFLMQAIMHLFHFLKWYYMLKSNDM